MTTAVCLGTCNSDDPLCPIIKKMKRVWGMTGDGKCPYGMCPTCEMKVEFQSLFNEIDTLGPLILFDLWPKTKEKLNEKKDDDSVELQNKMMKLIEISQDMQTYENILKETSIKKNGRVVVEQRIQAYRNTLVAFQTACNEILLDLQVASDSSGNKQSSTTATAAAATVTTSTSAATATKDK